MSVHLGPPKDHHKKKRPVHPSMHLLNPAFDAKDGVSDSWAKTTAKKYKKGETIDFMTTNTVEMPESEDKGGKGKVSLLM